MKPIVVVDLFAGAGGTSAGLAQACESLGVKVELTAINHWKKAVETHQRNHPWATHICSDVRALEPTEVVKGGRANGITASPECRHHSLAAGGKPKNPQSRASGWDVLRWVELLSPDWVLIENVPEYRDWGPLYANGNPIKQLKGETYRTFLAGIRSLNYSLEQRILNAADYGAATSRKRLFIVARRGKKAIPWPVPTHSQAGWPGKKWRAAREIIDFTTPSPSIFGRKRPLSPNTLKRIWEGLRRFGGSEVQPFLVLMEHSKDGSSHVRSIAEPMPTITTAKGGAIGIAEPFILSQASGGAPRSVEDPAPTICTDGFLRVAEPFILPVEGFYQEGPNDHNPAKSMDEPLGAITQRGYGHVVEPFLVRLNGTDESKINGSVEEPAPTITTQNHLGLAEPCLVKYYGNGNGAQSVDEPVGTLTTRDRFGLVQPVIDGKVLDVRFRMLKPSELAAATGFPAGYSFVGTRTDVVKQIGNAVVVEMAKALCLSLLSAEC